MPRQGLLSCELLAMPAAGADVTVVLNVYDGTSSLQSNMADQSLYLVAQSYFDTLFSENIVFL
jgi:hypothetical protein